MTERTIHRENSVEKARGEDMPGVFKKHQEGFVTGCILSELVEESSKHIEDLEHDSK